MSSPFSELGRLLGPARVIEDEPTRLLYARDSWPQAIGWTREELASHLPAAVIRPRDEKGVAAVLAWAASQGCAVVPRGAGSGVLGAAVPQRPKSLVLDVSGLTETFRVEDRPDGPTVVCGAGLRGSDLEARLQARGWSLMHFPQSMEDSCVGGWVATDSFGQLSTRYGGVRDQLRWVKAALPDGSLRAEQADLHLGAEGTLGVITEASLRIRPAAAGRQFHAWGFGALEAALDFARAAVSAKPPPSVLRLYCPVDAFFNGLHHRHAARSSPASSWTGAVQSIVLKRIGALRAISPLLGRKWVCVLIYEDEPGFEGGAPAAAPRASALGPGPAMRWWERRYHLDKARLERVFRQGCFADTMDLWAPWDRLEALHLGVLEAVKPHAFAFAHLSHFDAKGACLYVTVAGHGPGDHLAAWKAAMEACVRLGGKVNHHHGVGLAKLPWIDWALDPRWKRLWQAEKARRDFRGLLNPGKLW
ncbi:MAG: FAD-binding oxidoreductase [Elusimicrobia bacterium]|nr:FAD-binding oxidoreductase [Elusimicrobiota bacterium]